MLFKQECLGQIAQGQVTSAYRRWKRPTVKQGGTLRTPVGVLAIVSVEEIDEASLGLRAARQAGFSSVEALRKTLVAREGTKLYRVRFQLAGEDPRLALRERSRITKEEIEDILAKLAGMDSRSKHGPWTGPALRLIAANPETRAPDLAASLGLETVPFKRNIRKLKELGLTESLAVGYRLSPRGKALLKTIEAS